MSRNNLTPAERRLASQAGSYESWARTPDRSARTEAARRAADAKFEHQVDPNGELLPAERAKRAEAARRAHFKRMAFESVKARRLAKEARRAELVGERSEAS